MCGIAGFYGFRNDNLIKKFSKELTHRGPDGEGYYIDDQVTLLNRRLAIIDVKGGDQPIYNEDKSIVIVYNGEIYNYRGLREQLEAKGHQFSTKSDTEVIVHGYEEWGEKSFDRLNGMSGIALYDIKKKKLVLARDHFGIKPLYYSLISTNSADSVTRDPFFSPVRPAVRRAPRSSKRYLAHDTCRIIFSSEIKPILNSGLIRVKPNDRVIYRYLKYRVHDDTEETFFDEIYRLLPGQMAIIENGEIRLKNFSNLEKELLETVGEKKTDEKTIEIFKEKLIEAIRLRLISEVPVGSCLSGGLDSSTIVSVVNKLLKEKVKEAESVGKIQNTFSAVFPNQSNDEKRYIDELLKKNKVKSYKVKPTPEEFFQDMTDFVRTQEEPTVSTGPYAQYKVMQLAHKKITVALDGQGSDEMMAGYLPYYFVYLRELYKKKNFLRLFKEILGSLDVLTKYFIGFKKKIDAESLLNKNYAEEYMHERFIITNDDLKKRLVEDIFHNSLQSLLRYEDRNAMRFSIEGRVPFLDFNLLRYLFSLGSDAIIKNGWNKYILREATKNLLPSLINQRRNKIGFTTPECEWFIRMKNKIYSLFLSDSFAKRKYFNQQEVLKAFQEFIEGKVDDTMVFWRMMNIELWMREFIDEVQPLGVRPLKKKKKEIKVDGKTYYRYPIKTELFKKGDDYVEKIAKYVGDFLSMEIPKQVRDNFSTKNWFIVVSEKIVAIAQGRSYFIWDIKPSFFAQFLSKFVTRTPYGIGLGSPWTMQLAINEVGLPRIILATVVSQIGKVCGVRGLFYIIVGPTVRSIDGPTEYSLYPSNVSAKLGPKDPEFASQKIAKAIESKFKSASWRTNFLGVAVIDANDLGQNVLGNSTNLQNKLIEKIFRDNPMGQSDEQTPITIVFQND